MRFASDVSHRGYKPVSNFDIDMDEESGKSSSTASTPRTFNRRLLWNRRLHWLKGSWAAPRDPSFLKKLLVALIAINIILLAFVSVWYTTLARLTQRLPAPFTQNGLSKVIANWHEPGASNATIYWSPDFSRDVRPIACHSHNDYWRQVPLYDALQAGCTGFAADISLIAGELYVGHSPHDHKPNRTLKSLYINPLQTILENQNAAPTPSMTADGNVTASPRGMFDTSPNQTVILVLDMKNDPNETFTTAQSQLEPLREKGWLTYWNGTSDSIVPGPVTVVGTGDTPFPLVIANTTYRDIFMDAPLPDLVTPPGQATYNTSNSLYASTSFGRALGRVSFTGMSKSQLRTAKAQVEAAKALGLMPRYWGTPAWPVSLRTRIWQQLEQVGVGMLNVDDLYSASHWNWDWCVVMGMSVC